MPSLTSEYTLRYPNGVAESSSTRMESPTRVDQYQLSGRPFVSPVLVSMETTSDGQVLLSDELLDCYGVGDTVGEAVEDLISMLLEYQAELSNSDNLSEHLQRQLGRLDYFLGRRT